MHHNNHLLMQSPPLNCIKNQNPQTKNYTLFELRSLNGVRRSNNHHYHQKQSAPLNCIKKKWESQQSKKINLLELGFLNGRRSIIIASASRNAETPFWDNWVPEKEYKSSSFSDILWPSAGAFVAMALLGQVDKLLEPKGISMTIAPFGAVCAVLFTTPSSPGARKYNMFMAQIACAIIGVVALSIFGSGWLARSSALAAAIAFMIYTRSIHPPAASLPLLFIDGAKLHHLNFWYALFPGAIGCIALCLIQEIVCYLKENFRF